MLLSQHFERAAQKVFPSLVLHHEEFTCPNTLPPSPVSSYPTISPFTFYKAGWLSVALVVTELNRCPDVIRLAALWCSDFPLFI